MPIDGKTREDAWRLVTEYTDSPGLRSHMLGVEAAMRGYAKKFGEDAETWGIVGLLHDFDYEKHQGENGHPFVGVQILDERGVAADLGLVGAHLVGDDLDDLRFDLLRRHWDSPR